MNTDKIYAESIAKDTSKVVAIKKLDRKAKRPAEIFAFTFGIITALIAGAGMCLSMQVIGPATTAAMATGVVIGIIGFIGMGINYPVFKRILEKSKKKYVKKLKSTVLPSICITKPSAICFMSAWNM